MNHSYSHCFINTFLEAILSIKKEVKVLRGDTYIWVHNHIILQLLLYCGFFSTSDFFFLGPYTNITYFRSDVSLSLGTVNFRKLLLLEILLSSSFQILSTLVKQNVDSQRTSEE